MHASIWKLPKQQISLFHSPAFCCRRFFLRIKKYTYPFSRLLSVALIPIWQKPLPEFYFLWFLLSTFQINKLEQQQQPNTQRIQKRCLCSLSNFLSFALGLSIVRLFACRCKHRIPKWAGYDDNAKKRKKREMLCSPDRYIDVISLIMLKSIYDLFVTNQLKILIQFRKKIPFSIGKKVKFVFFRLSVFTMLWI